MGCGDYSRAFWEVLEKHNGAVVDRTAPYAQNVMSDYRTDCSIASIFSGVKGSVAFSSTDVSASKFSLET